MGEKLDKPILNKNPIDGKTDIFRYGMNEIQGWKKTMEVYNIKQIEIDKKNNINIFGLFDGHSGNEISQYLSEQFPIELSKNNNFINGDYKKALSETFKNIDISLRTEEVNNKLNIYSQQNKLNQKEKINDIYKTIDNQNNLNENDLEEINTFMDILDPNNLEGVYISDYVGSSGIIILISEKITYIANAGNSHCIAINKNLTLIKDKNIIEQNNYDYNEKKRIKTAKGFKYGKEKEKQYEKEEYLYTRGFGDFQYKNNNLVNIEDQEISCKPDIFEISNDDIKFLIICNSGFYDSGIIFDNEYKNIERNMATYFLQKLQSEQKIISDIIGDYINGVIQIQNSKNQNYIDDNLSCIIIDFFDK